MDFYASQPKIVIEVDGSQHMEPGQEQKDIQRDVYLKNKGLYILRFDNLQVLQEMNSVMEVIYQTVEERLGIGNPPGPPLKKGEWYHEGKALARSFNRERRPEGHRQILSTKSSQIR